MNRQQWEVRIIDSPDYFDGLTKVLDGTAPFLSSDGDPKSRNCLRNATAAIAVACPDDESGMCLVNVGLLHQAHYAWLESTWGRVLALGATYQALPSVKVVAVRA